LCVFKPKTGGIFERARDRAKLLLIRRRISHSTWHENHWLWTLGDLKKSLRTLLCQSCCIVAKR